MISCGLKFTKNTSNDYTKPEVISSKKSNVYTKTERTSSIKPKLINSKNTSNVYTRPEQTSSINNNIYKFYNDPNYKYPSNQDHRHTYNNVMKYNDKRLEFHHDYIQILLPTKTKSAYNIVDEITDDVIRVMKADGHIINRMNEAVRRMIKFWTDKFNSFLNGKYDHNFARISRAIECIYTFDLKDVKEEFNKFLNNLLRNPGINSKSKNIWEKMRDRYIEEFEKK